MLDVLDSDDGASAQTRLYIRQSSVACTQLDQLAGPRHGDLRTHHPRLGAQARQARRTFRICDARRRCEQTQEAPRACWRAITCARCKSRNLDASDCEALIRPGLGVRRCAEICHGGSVGVWTKKKAARTWKSLRATSKEDLPSQAINFSLLTRGHQANLSIFPQMN